MGNWPLADYFGVAPDEPLSARDWEKMAFDVIEEEWCGDDLWAMVAMCRDRFSFEDIRYNLGIKRGWFSDNVLRSAVKYQKRLWRAAGL